MQPSCRSRDARIGPLEPRYTRPNLTMVSSPGRAAGTKSQAAAAGRFAGVFWFRRAARALKAGIVRTVGVELMCLRSAAFLARKLSTESRSAPQSPPTPTTTSSTSASSSARARSPASAKYSAISSSSLASNSPGSSALLAFRASKGTPHSANSSGMRSRTDIQAGRLGLSRGHEASACSG